MIQVLYDVGGTLASVCLLTAISYLTKLYQPAIVCIVIQWIVALFQAIPQQRETYYDVTGSVTFAIVSLQSILLAKVRDWHSILLSILVWVWCIRLGTYLYQRIRGSGQDKRFENIRSNPLLFFSAWSLQGFWVFNTLLPVLLSHERRAPLRGVKPVQWTDAVGLLVWIVGFLMETIADAQKSNFRAIASNRDRFITHGLWKYSRHPNYCGEMLVWFGVYCLSISSLQNPLDYTLAASSPLVVIILLTKVSGIPLLEKHADEKWGASALYQGYKVRTNLLIPIPLSVG